MAEAVGRERVTQLLFYGALLLLAYLLYQIVEPFLVQLGWAAVLAICIRPFHAGLERRLGPTRAALASTLLVLVLIIAPAIGVMSALIGEGGHAVTSVQEALRSQGSERVQAVWDWAQQHVTLPPIDEVKSAVVSRIGSMAGLIAAKAGGIARDAAVFVFDLVVTLLALFFLLRDGAAVERAIRRLLPFEEGHKDRLIAQTRELVAASVTASLVIAVIQGLIGGVTFAILGVRAAVLWGVVMAIASLLPVVGTGLVWLPAGVWLLVSGEVARGIVLLAVGAVVISNVDNVVRPLLLADKSTMNGLVVFISLMGGVSAFGPIGLILGPLVVATVTALLEDYTERPVPGEPAAAASPGTPP
jgi:predicted PurR-regulated permease PerM